MAAQKNLKGNISISRPHHSGEWQYIEISIVDSLSGAQFVEARVSLADFAEALTGLHHVDCEFDFRPALVGLKYEHKTERVKYSGGYLQSDARSNPKTAKALAPFENDGWKGRVDDLFNHHMRNHDGTFNVLFTRHVKANIHD